MPSPRRVASPSIWYKAPGCTAERADQGAPENPDMVAIICAGSRESGQNRQTDSARATFSGTSSPVITQERVIGSLRSSMHKESISSHPRQLPSGSTFFLHRVADGAVCYNPRTKPREMTEPSTPLMRQYAAIKKEHPSALLFFRLGDFYELFFDDAILASRELQITLTSRNKEKGVAIPMCGVPFHAAEGYIAKLIRKGFKVAICEQVEDARMAKKLVRREVTRMVTPGTAADSSLGAEDNNFLAAIATVGDHVGFAALDLSTGDFRATEFSGEGALRRAQEEREQLRPKEVLYGSTAPLFESSNNARPPIRHGQHAVSPMQSSSAIGYAETALDDWIFAPDHAIP